MENHKAAHPYSQLLIMAVLSFISMYVLMYAMVNAFANVFASFNQVYMAALMTAPMVIIELIVMRRMYPQRRVNAVIIAVSAVVLVACWLSIRFQVGIGDGQFVRSMIPHHAGAILMCNEAPLRDQELQSLCRSIVAGQQAEIDQMKAKLRELAK